MFAEYDGRCDCLQDSNPQQLQSGGTSSEVQFSPLGSSASMIIQSRHPSDAVCMSMDSAAPASGSRHDSQPSRGMSVSNDSTQPSAAFAPSQQLAWEPFPPATPGILPPRVSPVPGSDTPSSSGVSTTHRGVPDSSGVAAFMDLLSMDTQNMPAWPAATQSSAWTAQAQAVDTAGTMEAVTQQNHPVIERGLGNNAEARWSDILQGQNADAQGSADVFASLPFNVWDTWPPSTLQATHGTSASAAWPNSEADSISEKAAAGNTATQCRGDQGSNPFASNEERRHTDQGWGVAGGRDAELAAVRQQVCTFLTRPRLVLSKLGNVYW